MINTHATLPSITRRESLKLGTAALAGSALAFKTGFLAAQSTETSYEIPYQYGLSIFGDLKYKPNFSHFDYVNPDAPKGGRLVLQPASWINNQNPQTFNTLNGFVTKGDAPPRLELMFDSLMARAFDEPDAIYGLVAEAVAVSRNGDQCQFLLRKEATFHDGSPIRAEDVVFSLKTLQQSGHPNYRQSFQAISRIQALGEDRVLIQFDGSQSRQLIFEVADAPIFSKKYYEPRDFEAATMEPPLGSGPYRIGRFEPGQFIEYTRVENYWAQDLPVMCGHNNFDVIRIEFFRERQAAFEAFKKGEITFRQESVAKSWATEYNFPAIKDGRAKRLTFPSEARPRFQGTFFNTRRDKFAHIKTREALGLCFDFEWLNTNLFYNSYKRLSSHVEGSIYKASDKPSAAELDLLEPFRDQLSDTVFGPAITPPVSDGTGRDRKLLRQASLLMVEAGWSIRDGQLYNASGQKFTIEILIRSPTFERVFAKYIENLNSIGVEARIRLVDPAQFQARINSFDFDMAGMALSLSATPFTSASLLFSSQSANTSGSYNWAGINDPVVDALVEKIQQADTRQIHQTAWRALDRVVRAGHYWVSGWYIDQHHVAVWDQFGWPDNKPDYYFPFETTWWSTDT